MKVSKANYYQAIAEIGFENLPQSVKIGHSLIDKITKQGTDWTLSIGEKKSFFEKQFEAVELLLAAKEEKKNPAPSTQHQQHHATAHSAASQRSSRKKAPVTEPEDEHEEEQEARSSRKTSSVNKTAAKKPLQKQQVTVDSEGLELLHPDVALIKRYALFHGKRKSKLQILSFIKTLQRAIAEKRIGKTSTHAKTIDEIQRSLIKDYSSLRRDIDTKEYQFKESDLIRFLKIAKSEHILPSVRFIKSFIGLQEKKVEPEKAKKLYNRIFDSFEKGIVTKKDRYYKFLESIMKRLLEFYENGSRSGKIEISERELSGLNGALKKCGCHHQHLSKEEDEEEFSGNELSGADDRSGVMTVEEVRKANFKTVPLGEKWERLLGKICLPTHLLVYGLGGSGKTSFVLQFCQHLSDLGYRILYVAKEQFGTPTFTELLNRLNIVAGNNFKVVREIDEDEYSKNPVNFDFVVLDSKDDMYIDLDRFTNLKEEFPKQSFILISHGTKAGDFTGSGRWRNAVDVMVKAEDGVVSTGEDKNRWGGSGELRIF